MSDPVDLGTLREAVVSGILDRWRALVGDETYLQASERFADAVLALPEFAALLDEVRRLQAAVTAVQEWSSDVTEVLGGDKALEYMLGRLRRLLAAALSGEAPEDGEAR